MNDALNNPHTKEALYQDAIKCLGTYSFTATFSLDTRTMEQFKHVQGLISFLCVLRQGSEVIAEGRGIGKLSKINKYIDRTILFSRNSAFLDAVTRAIKILDVLPLNVSNQHNDTTVVKQKPVVNNSKLYITPKQKGYILELVKTRVKDIEERNRWQSVLDKFTREEASEAIQKLSK